jgi:ribosomal protein S12 methylthiotransferase
MRSEFPEVDCILQVGCAGDIVRAVRAAYGGEKLSLEAEPGRLELGGERILSTMPFYAYLKIAEGCDNRCSYCVIPALRGPYRSRPVEDLLAEAEKLAGGGVRELVLVAQDTTRYGYDIYGRLALPELLRKLCAVEGLKWIRLLYCYPDWMTDELIDTVAKEEKIVKYLDIPIQHVNKRIIAAMNRRMEKRPLLELIERLRAKIPGVTLRTTLIVGFPGETRAEFEELAEFVKDVGFERMGAFAYSREEGTPAYDMEGQLDEEEKLHRQELLMTVQMAVNEAYNRRAQGRSVEVLTEGFDRSAGLYFGRSGGEAPDIDGKIFFKSSGKLKPGDFAQVQISGVCDYDLLGEARQGSAKITEAQ